MAFYNLPGWKHRSARWHHPRPCSVCPQVQETAAVLTGTLGISLTTEEPGPGHWPQLDSLAAPQRAPDPCACSRNESSLLCQSGGFSWADASSVSQKHGSEANSRADPTGSDAGNLASAPHCPMEGTGLTSKENLCAPHFNLTQKPWQKISMYEFPREKLPRFTGVPARGTPMN